MPRPVVNAPPELLCARRCTDVPVHGRGEVHVFPLRIITIS